MTRPTTLECLARTDVAWQILACLALLLSLVPGTQAEDATPETVTKTLKWTTASEVDNFGYDVYRGESEEGPFARRTEDPVLGAGTTDEPTSYRYVDDGLIPGTDYYYYVESISIHGERERFTPIMKVTAKAPTADDAPADGDAASEPSPGGDG